MQKINVGFIGCGRISDLHYNGYVKNSQARLYAICDTDAELLKQRKKQWKVEKTYLDYNEMLADPEIDAIEVLSPTFLHEEMAIAAAKAGKHISLQKPMANTLKSADLILKTQRKYNSSKVLKVFDNYVWYPPVMTARKIIESGQIGEPRNMRIKFIMGRGGWEVSPEAWEWRIREGMDGRPLNTFDHGHHLWAVAMYLQGRMEKVCSWIDTLDGVVDVPATIMWKGLDNSRYGTCDYANASDMVIPSEYYSNDEWFEITGTKGIVIVQRCTGHLIEKPAVRLYDGKKWKNYGDIPCDWATGFVESTNNFIRAIRGEEPPFFSGDEGRELLRFDLAIQRSNQIRRAVYLEELDRAFPSIHAWKKRRAEIKKNPFTSRKSIMSLFTRDLSRYAGEAEELTGGLMERFREEKAQGWTTSIGLVLDADGTVGKQEYSLLLKDGKPELVKDELPENPVMTITVPAGTWAAILKGKKRLEMALIQGKFKIQGKAEEGLKLREVFNL